MITRDDCIEIGKITKTHGLEGHVVIVTDNDLLEEYVEEPVFILLDGAPVPFFIAPDGLAVRNAGSYLVKFDFVDTSRQAEYLVGNEVLLEKALLEDMEEEPEDAGILSWVGFQVEDENTHRTGKIVGIADYSGNIVLSLSIFDKEVLLPLAEEYIKEVNPEERKLLVSIPQELADLY